MNLVRHISLLCILSLVAPFAVSFAIAQDSDDLAPKLDFPFVGEVTTDRVNLRTGPSVDYRILRKLQPREKLVAVGQDSDWFQVRVPAGFTGYVLETLVEKKGERSAVVKDDSVNFRPTPSTQYFPAGQVRKGEELTVLGREGDWLHVEAPHRFLAFVAKEFVRPLGPESEYELDLAQLAADARKARLRGAAGNAESAVADAMRVDIRSTFDQAEILYGRAKASESGDYTEATELYRKVADQTLFPDLAEIARARLDAIDSQASLRETLDDADSIRKKLEADLESARTKYEQELARIRSERSEASVKAVRDFEVGWVVRHSPMNPFDTSEPRYKLIKGGRVICHLESRKYDLRDFLDRQALVSGDYATDPNTKLRILYVRKLEILGKR